jgi:hypothetical protein|tara:strand:- start:1116 stop:1295 length:180 start_codon:yes stop_codon:yes gene_type:complete
MGFNKRILPKIDKLKVYYYNDPESYIRGIIKVDAMIGSMESIDWINDRVKEHYERASKK